VADAGAVCAAADDAIAIAANDPAAKNSIALLLEDARPLNRESHITRTPFYADDLKTRRRVFFLALVSRFASLVSCMKVLIVKPLLVLI
jgi:hypothetical protein